MTYHFAVKNLFETYLLNTIVTAVSIGAQFGSPHWTSCTETCASLLISCGIISIDHCSIFLNAAFLSSSSLFCEATFPGRNIVDRCNLLQVAETVLLCCVLSCVVFDLSPSEQGCFVHSVVAIRFSPAPFQSDMQTDYSITMDRLSFIMSVNHGLKVTNWFS